MRSSTARSNSSIGPVPGLVPVRGWGGVLLDGGDRGLDLGAAVQPVYAGTGITRAEIEAAIAAIEQDATLPPDGYEPRYRAEP